MAQQTDALSSETNDAASERLSEVSRLSTLLADRVLAAQAADEPVPKAHINALLDAAIILDKYEVDLPAPLGQIIDQIGDAEDKDAGRLAWLFRPFQRAKG
ncbi:hypothetical protein [Methylobacterium sp. Leaf117]|uniref:hypothetical protein n=1 Tax=Methylobacterium sp. Leaf117 TaxID=1736260 RepID=UPI0006F95D6B|nr:hypothetical protein [Methylobacterium sp. Leaf117]KQP80654.1 hypothetical protein ASF57_17475 [Methylobacterium sp. Leaf117]